MRSAILRLGLAILLAPCPAAPLQALAAAHGGDAVEAQFRALQDLTLPDEQRATARNNIINVIYRGDKAAIERLLKLGEDTADDRIRLDVAFVLAQTRNRRTIVPAGYSKAAIALLSKWLDGKGAHAGVQLWAATGLAATQDPTVVPLLRDKALSPDGESKIRVAAARALAAWRGNALETAVVPLLVGMLKDKEPEIRIAACDALRLTELDSLLTVEPLLEVAKGDADERVWRAAVAALRRIGGGALMVPSGASDEDRQQRIQTWENIWRRKKRLESK